MWIICKKCPDMMHSYKKSIDVLIRRRKKNNRLFYLLLNLQFKIEHVILFTPLIFVTWIKLVIESLSVNLFCWQVLWTTLSGLSFPLSPTWTFPGLMSAFSSQLQVVSSTTPYYFLWIYFPIRFFVVVVVVRNQWYWMCCCQMIFW